MASLFAGCGGNEDESTKNDASTSESSSVEDSSSEENSSSEDEVKEDPYTFKVGGLKGPTSIGMVKLMKDSANGETEGDYEFTIGIVVWKSCIKNSSKIYYANSDGIVTGVENTSFNKNTVDFYHGVFVQSSYFSDLPTLINSEDASFIEYGDGQKKTMRDLKKRIRSLLDETLHKFLLVRADRFIEKMESDALLPVFSGDDFGECKKRDFINVTREIYCVEPKIFHKLKPQQSKSILGFLALLLDSNERENVLTVLEQIVALTPEQRAKFVQVLRRTRCDGYYSKKT